MSQLLHIENLSVGYKNKAIIEAVEFQLNKGEICAIVGVNGIGKSTLLRTLGKLQPKINGSIQIENRELEAYSPIDLAKQIALVLTDSIASKNLRVKELLALGRQPHTNWIGTLLKEDQEIIRETLQNFQLENLKDKKCHELSDGQLQRVLIARAMVQDTPLILLDEPTTHLDLSHKVGIFKLLKDLAHVHKRTVLLTTHEIELAIQLADKMLVLNGKENPFGTPQDLISKGYFDELFPKDVVQFDAKTGTFRVKN
ncbi:ABC transporter ATP-binding protein [Croceivirga thetidis]|uniref:ABC transporter ATP-binding protein n=1 Tax=Croceivirga thetidis TaxID=2721623 RepID=UPI001FF08BDA|nr:ABC transporter ATP-binding protein [Croceivirga thetidis]